MASDSSSRPEWLPEYREFLGTFPPLHDTWFPAALAKARCGDRESRRQILGSSLRLVVEVAEGLRFGLRPEDAGSSLQALIETGNAVLGDCLARFTGEGAQEYCDEVRAALRRRIAEELKKFKEG